MGIYGQFDAILSEPFLLSILSEAHWVMLVLENRTIHIPRRPTPSVATKWLRILMFVSEPGHCGSVQVS